VSRLGLATCDGNGIRKEIVNDIVQDSETDYVSAVPDQVFMRLKDVWSDSNAEQQMLSIVKEYREQVFFEDLLLEIGVLLGIKKYFEEGPPLPNG
jgi:hypothetical protein